MNRFVRPSRQAISAAHGSRFRALALMALLAAPALGLVDRHAGQRFNEAMLQHQIALVDERLRPPAPTARPQLPSMERNPAQPEPDR